MGRLVGHSVKGQRQISARDDSQIKANIDIKIWMRKGYGFAESYR
jgi:hypothetical protein